MVLQTKLGKLLRQLNMEYGKVNEGWGTTGIMLNVMFSFAIFLLIILQIYNSSLVINDLDVTWTN